MEYGSGKLRQGLLYTEEGGDGDSKMGKDSLEIQSVGDAPRRSARRGPRKLTGECGWRSAAPDRCCDSRVDLCLFHSSS